MVSNLSPKVHFYTCHVHSHDDGVLASEIDLLVIEALTAQFRIITQKHTQ